MRFLHLIAALAALLAIAACGQSETSTEASDSVSNCATPGADGVIEITDGLVATVTSRGYGRAAVPGDYADVHTTLWLYDEAAEGGRGTEIWTSGGDQPFQFRLDAGQVIKGWDLGVACMLIGETRELIIGPDLGYGARGKPPVPPNATLLFEIELVNLTASN